MSYSKAVKIIDNLYWVGAVDWDVRDSVTEPPIVSKWVPDEENLKQCRKLGERLALQAAQGAK